MAHNAVELERLGLVYPALLDPRGKLSRKHAALTGKRTSQDDSSIDLDSGGWKIIASIAAAGDKNILLSSEMFSTAFRDETKFNSVLDFFDASGYRVVVIAYVRDQPDWLNSWYVQYQKRFMGHDGFEAYVAAAAKSGRVDPWRYLERMIDNPRVELDVVPFEQVAALGLEADFARRVGVPADADLQPVPRRNPNVGAKTVFAAQQILARSPTEIRKMRNYDRIYHRFRRFYRELWAEDAAFVALDEALYKDIRGPLRGEQQQVFPKILRCAVGGRVSAAAEATLRALLRNRDCGRGGRDRDGRRSGPRSRPEKPEGRRAVRQARADFRDRRRSAAVPARWRPRRS